VRATSSPLRTAGRLNLDALGDLPPESRPRIDPRGLPIGIVHLGIGAFHRAHQAVYTEEAMARAGGDWGICGVTQRSRDVVEVLAPQDGLYSLAVRGDGPERLRVVGSVREVRWAREDPGGLLERIAAPSTALITLTVSEKGYRIDPATNRLRLDDPDVAADLKHGTSRTVIGQLVHGLERRRRVGGAPITVLCCDNLPSNGPVLAGLVREFVEHARAPEREALQDWISAMVRFPATMVDRIVPASTAEDRDAAARRLGVRDRGLVVTEPFSQWVIEDDFAGSRPAWEQAGAEMTDDVAPYERIKLRMLNGSHSMLAYLGVLADRELVSDAVSSDGLRAAVAGLMAADVAPTLAPPAGFDLDRYQRDLMRRYANPALRHRTTQITMDGSQKLPQRLLGTIRDRRRAGAEPMLAILAVAAWMRFVSARRSGSGRPLTVDDPLADVIAARLAGREAPADVVDELLSLREVFTEDLASDRVLRDMLVDLLTRLIRDGAERTAAAVATERAAS
jgi:fructuronate reductase